MKLLAYGRRVRGASAADQVLRAEAIARSRGHEPVRLATHELHKACREYPPRETVLEACRRRVVGGVVVIDLAALGPDLAGTLLELREVGALVLVAGNEELPSIELGPPEMALAFEVAGAAQRARRLSAGLRRRVGRAQLRIDPESVQARMRDGARLEDVARELDVSKSSLVRSLRRQREEHNGKR